MITNDGIRAADQLLYQLLQIILNFYFLFQVLDIFEPALHVDHLRYVQVDFLLGHPLVPNLAASCKLDVFIYTKLLLIVVLIIGTVFRQI